MAEPLMSRSAIENMRDRMDMVSERVIKAEGRQQAHEAVCIQLNTRILEEIAGLRASLRNVCQIGLTIAGLLFLLELGKATIPGIIEIIAKAH